MSTLVEVWTEAQQAEMGERERETLQKLGASEKSPHLTSGWVLRDE